MTHKTKKLGKGHYLYRGYDIWCVGYYPPEQRVCWECVDEHGHGFGHAYTLKECKGWIDIEIDVWSELPTTEVTGISDAVNKRKNKSEENV